MLKCGEQWRLSRGLHLPERPQWALVGGSAVHAATEELDALDVLPDNFRDIFNAHFDVCIKEQLDRYDGKWTTEDFRASGRASKQWPDKENDAWWRANGPTFVGNWVNYRRQTSMELWYDEDGRGAIEWEATVTLGGLPVKVVIDRLFTGPHGLTLMDIKSGSTLPKDSMQLGIYGLALKQDKGMDVRYGQFFDARKGQTTPPADLNLWTQERLDYVFRSVRAMQEQGIFLANPSNMCSACGVKDYCLTMGGSLAHTVPPAWSDTDNV